MATGDGPQNREPAWHTLGSDAVVAQFASDATSGLSHGEASRRLERHGANLLAASGVRPWPAMLAAQFTDFMILVLVAAAVVAGIVGEPQDAIAILVIVVLNGVIGFAQEYRAEKAMAALRRMAAHKARVVREGEIHVIEAIDLVPGDLVCLEAGDVVPGDIRLVEAVRLQAEEAALTG